MGVALLSCCHGDVFSAQRNLHQRFSVNTLAVLQKPAWHRGHCNSSLKCPDGKWSRALSQTWISTFLWHLVFLASCMRKWDSVYQLYLKSHCAALVLDTQVQWFTTISKCCHDFTWKQEKKLPKFISFMSWLCLAEEHFLMLRSYKILINIAEIQI